MKQKKKKELEIVTEKKLSKTIVDLSPELDSYLEWLKLTNNTSKSDIIRNILKDMMSVDAKYSKYREFMKS